MAYPRLTDMTTEQLRSLLEGPKIALYYKSDINATSEIQLAAVPLNAVKTFSPKIRKVFSKYPGDKSYTITGGAKYAYTMIVNHILSCCQAGKISPLSRHNFIDYGNAVNAFNSLGMTYFANNVHRHMKVCKAFDDDVHGALAGLQAAASVDNQDTI